MKKTLSLLAVAALGLSAAPCMAKTLTIYPKIPSFQSPIEQNTIAPGATLLNTVTGGVVIYDINTNPANNPPFDIDEGSAYWGFDIYSTKVYDVVTLEDVAVSEGDEIVLDFTTWYTGGGAGMGGPEDKEYFVIMFRHQDGEGNNFATWYESLENDVPITAKFTTGTYSAYIITETCDQADTASTWGGLVFFNESVQEAVLLAEVEPGEGGSPAVPEPTTATLSLLALAGLAMRRRRR